MGQQPNKYPMLMWVGDTKAELAKRKTKRVVFAEKCGMYLSWSDAETFDAAEHVTDVYPYTYAVPIKSHIKLTRAEIATKFGVDSVEIID